MSRCSWVINEVLHAVFFDYYESIVKEIMNENDENRRQQFFDQRTWTIFIKMNEKNEKTVNNVRSHIWRHKDRMQSRRYRSSVQVSKNVTREDRLSCNVTASSLEDRFDRKIFIDKESRVNRAQLINCMHWEYCMHWIKQKNFELEIELRSNVDIRWDLNNWYHALFCMQFFEKQFTIKLYKLINTSSSMLFKIFDWSNELNWFSSFLF